MKKIILQHTYQTILYCLALRIMRFILNYLKITRSFLHDTFLKYNLHIHREFIKICFIIDDFLKKKNYRHFYQKQVEAISLKEHVKFYNLRDIKSDREIVTHVTIKIFHRTLGWLFEDKTI